MSAACSYGNPDRPALRADPHQHFDRQAASRRLVSSVLPAKLNVRTRTVTPPIDCIGGGQGPCVRMMPEIDGNRRNNREYR